MAAVLGDSGGFGAPQGTDVEAYQVWGRTYAVAASRDADGIYVVDVTDPARPAPVAAVFDDSGGFDALRGAHDAEVFGADGRTYAVVAARDDDGVQVMDVTPPLPHYLNASVKVTGYERLPHGDNDFVRVAAEITNRGQAALSGELRVSLNALANWRAVQSCDMAQNHCTRPNGDYIAYHDVDRGQAEAYGVTVSEDDCTARGRMGRGIRRGRGGEFLLLGGRGVRARVRAVLPCCGGPRSVRAVYGGTDRATCRTCCATSRP